MSGYAYWIDCTPTLGVPYVIGPLSSYDQAVTEKEILEVADPSGSFEVRGEPSLDPEAFV